MSPPIYVIEEKKPEKNYWIHVEALFFFQASFPQLHKLVGSRWGSCNYLLLSVVQLNNLIYHLKTNYAN